MHLPELSIRLPDWVEPFLVGQPQIFPSREDRMWLAIELSRLNLLHASGGPFGAAVFDGEGRLVAPGMNLVVSSGCSMRKRWHWLLPRRCWGAMTLVTGERCSSSYMLGHGGLPS